MTKRTATTFLLSLAAATTFATPGARADDPDPVAKEEARLLPGGMLDGKKASFTFARGGGKTHASSMTTLRVDLSVPDLRVRVMPHSDWTETAEREGRLLVVKTNDAAFDKSWVVSGAPSDLVRTLVDDRLRGALEKLPDAYFEMDTSHVEVHVARALKGPSEADEMVAIADVAAKHVTAGLHPAPGIALTPDQRAKEMEKLAAADQAQQRSGLAFMIIPFLVGSALLGVMIMNIVKRSRGKA